MRSGWRGSRRPRCGCCASTTRSGRSCARLRTSTTARRPPRRRRCCASGSSRRARRGSAPTPRRTRWRSAWTRTAASTSRRSRGCSAPRRARRASSSASSSTTTPTGQRLVPAAEYLSGDVRVKLDAGPRGGRARHVAAGQRRARSSGCCPPDLGPEEIAPRLGAAWIDADTHRQFLSELLEDPTSRSSIPARRSGRSRAAPTRSRRPASGAPAGCDALADRQGGDGAAAGPGHRRDRRRRSRQRVLNATETAAAQEKADALQQRFGEWCWEDPERAGAPDPRVQRAVQQPRVARLQHRRRAADAARRRPHVRAARASARRGRADRWPSRPSACSTKSAPARPPTMAIAASELQRLGLVRKPAVVVPNHMLEQFSREWLQIYPQARVLAASGEDLAGDRRRQFVARVAANDWDAVIMTRSRVQPSAGLHRHRGRLRAPAGRAAARACWSARRVSVG